MPAKEESPLGDGAFVGCPGPGGTSPPLCFSFFSFRELGTVGITHLGCPGRTAINTLLQRKKLLLGEVAGAFRI